MDEWNNDRFERLDDLARLLPSLIVHLITEEDYLPPLDVTVGDALNNLVLWMVVNDQGVCRNIWDRDEAMTYTLPLVVTVTDSKGRTWTA